MNETGNVCNYQYIFKETYISSDCNWKLRINELHDKFSDFNCFINTENISVDNV